MGCAQCTPGYYRLDELCAKCPKGAFGFIVAEVAAISQSRVPSGLFASTCCLRW